MGMVLVAVEWHRIEEAHPCFPKDRPGACLTGQGVDS